MAFVVREEIVGIIRARPGQLIGWWLAHPFFTLWVSSADGKVITDRAFCPLGRAPSLLMEWDEAGVIEPLMGDIRALQMIA